MTFQKKVVRLLKIRFIGFSLVGGCVFLMGIAVLSFQIEILNVNKIVAGIITTIISVETNFFLNKYLNWKDREGSFSEHWFKFHGARLLTITLNQVFYITLVTKGLHYLVVTLMGTVLTTIINYIANDKFTFRTLKRRENVQERLDNHTCRGK